MANVIGKLWDVLAFIVRPAQRKTRVKFSPSTLHRELLRATKVAPSRNPFFNFLAEVRLQALRNNPDNRVTLTPRECVRTAKAAGRLWRLMSDEEKRPYRTMAKRQPKLKRLHNNRPRKCPSRRKINNQSPHKLRKTRCSNEVVTYTPPHTSIEPKQLSPNLKRYSMHDIYKNRKYIPR